MGCAPQFQNLYKFETNRLILVVGLVFSVSLVLQSSSFPYRGVLLSMLYPKSAIVEQSALAHNSNSTDSYTKVMDAKQEIKQYSEEESAVENAAFPNHNATEPEEVLSAEEEVNKSDNEGSSLIFGNVSSEETGFVSQPFPSPPMVVTTNMTFLNQSGANSSKTDVSTNPKMSPMGKEATKKLSKAKTTESVTKAKRKLPPTSISKMTSLLLQSRISSRAMRPRWSSVRDQELLLAKSQIESAPRVENDRELYPPLYRNVSMFKRSYDLMESRLKVYIYNEGVKPIFHQPNLEGIYASEGWFMKLMEGNKQFVVKDPTKAHMFYLPFSSHILRLTLNEYSKHHRNLAGFLKTYVDMIAGKYPFWNRTGGADHFFVACHDWAAQITTKYMGTCIRALCNANVAIDFKIGKDVSLPVTMVRFADDPLRSLGGKPPSKRPFLAFFAGNLHGYVRPILLQYWENKDPAMKIFGPLPRNAKPNYQQYMKSSKYCICARGYEVHTPRVVEAIFHECVPVIISDNYVPPFFEVLNWEAFSVFVLEKDIPNLKKILLSIPEKRYLELQMRVKKVQKHFLWHKNPVRHDVFHMTLHSIWYNRVFQIKPR